MTQKKQWKEKVNNNMRVFLNSKLFLTELAEGSVCSLVQEHSQALGVQPGTPQSSVLLQWVVEHWGTLRAAQGCRESSQGSSQILQSISTMR